MTDINNISYRNYNVLKFFIENNNAELRTLDHLHSKIYIMDNYPVITSANLTYYGFYVNFESAIAGDNLDIERYEQLYNELWNLGKTVDEDLLKIALKNSTYQDIEAYNPNVKITYFIILKIILHKIIIILMKLTQWQMIYY